VNDLTNRELIRRKFKFEEFQISKENTFGDDLMGNDIQEMEDDIFQGSEIFNNQGLLKKETNQIHETKDLTDMALLQRNKRRLFFSSKQVTYDGVELNEEPAEYDLHEQFQLVMQNSMKGRSDLLKMIGVPYNARTGSTAETEQTQMHSFGGTFNKYKHQLEET
jgi:hypothetical protein